MTVALIVQSIIMLVNAAFAIDATRHARRARKARDQAEQYAARAQSALQRARGELP